MRSLKKIPFVGMFGVCAGIAYWLRIPTWLVRFAMIMLYFCWSSFIIFPYLIFVLILPEWCDKPEDYESVSE